MIAGLKYFEIKKDMFLIEQQIPEASLDLKPSPTNHIWIYDRSYSMSNDLPALCKDLIYKAKDIGTGDTLSLGWFSSEGQYNFIIKGFRVIDSSDYTIIENAINRNSTPVGCTCFSEILEDSVKVIEDLSIISDNFSLMFFSDGYPVVNNYSKEITSIHKAIEKLEGKVTSSCIVGYGNYYNRELMMGIAERLGGSLIHSNDLPQFSIALKDLIKNSGNVNRKIPVKFTETKPTEDIIFSLNVDFKKSAVINIFKQREDNTILFSPVIGSDKEHIYFLTNTLTGNEEEVKITESDLTRPTYRESLIRAVYSLACILNQKAKTDKALEVLSSIGEIRIINILNNAFTNAEHGKAEELLRQAIHTPQNRILSGYSTTYLPSSEAFCLLDVIDILIKDNEAYFYPYHEDFKYTKISRGSKNKEDSPKFTAEKNPKCELATLAWHKSKLNLSIKALIKGTVDLGDHAEKHGFSKNYPTHIFRNYTIVKDGFINTPWLPVSLSKESYKKLSEEGVIWNNTPWDKDRIYVLELNKVPVMNRAIANGKTSAISLCNKVFEEIKIQAQLKVLNDIRKELEEKTDYVDAAFVGLSDSQLEFLTSKSITKNGFSPEVKKEEPTDFYYAKDFEVKVKSFSSLPSLKEVRTRIASGKLRPSDEVMKTGIDLYENSQVSSQSEKIKMFWVDEKINELKKNLLNVRSDIQRTKFSIILGKRWFTEFESRNESTIVVDGNTFSITIKEDKVTI